MIAISYTLITIGAALIAASLLADWPDNTRSNK